jgi:predicted SAM-dependent methyltransferase
VPGSSDKGKLTIVQWFNMLPTPVSVLDVGPGWGTYSRLLRRRGQTWHCVEVHEPYISRFRLARQYDEVFNEDIRTFVPRQSYDVAICGDVLEHLANDEAVAVLGTLLRTSSFVILSLPIDAETHADLGTCDVYWGNPHEMHRGLWSNRDFIKVISAVGGELIAMEKYEELAIYLVSSRSSDFVFEWVATPREWLLRRFSGRFANQLEGSSVMRRGLAAARSRLSPMLPHRLRRVLRDASGRRP